jgi:electron transfer flavoprotein-quinone oxidoreductase
MSEVDFDVAVVGAGPAGSLAAYRLAGAGHSVVLIERGDTPGSKNLSGGVLYDRVLDEVFPDFATVAPVERRVTRNVVSFLNEGSSVSLDYRDARLAEPVNAVTVLRARLDPWLAERAEEAGALLMPGVRVDSLIVEPGPGRGRVAGVVAGADELRAHVVVAADGAPSFLGRSVGLVPTAAHHQQAVGVKAIVELPAAQIEDRFHVGPDEGAAYALVGDCTYGIDGGAFCYTNRDSLSVGVVLRLDALVASGRRATDVFDHFLAHPDIAGLLAGGRFAEYGSHLVNEGGRDMMGPLVMDGLVVVGDAAGLTINSGLTIRGMDLAMGSGLAAADAIDAALTAGDVSAAGLASYGRRLDASFVGQDTATYAKAPAFLGRQRMYTDYGPLLAEVLHGAFDLDTTPRRHLATVGRAALRGSGVRVRDLLGDGLAGVRAL